MMGWKRRFVTTLYYRVQVPDLTQQRDLAGAPAGRSARSFSRWTSTRAVLLAAAGQNRWPPAGSYMAATGQDLMAADTGRTFGQLSAAGCFESLLINATRDSNLRGGVACNANTSPLDLPGGRSDTCSIDVLIGWRLSHCRAIV